MEYLLGTLYASKKYEALDVSRAGQRCRNTELSCSLPLQPIASEAGGGAAGEPHSESVSRPFPDPHKSTSSSADLKDGGPQHSFARNDTAKPSGIDGEQLQQPQQPHSSEFPTSWCLEYSVPIRELYGKYVLVYLRAPALPHLAGGSGHLVAPPATNGFQQPQQQASVGSVAASSSAALGAPSPSSPATCRSPTQRVFSSSHFTSLSRATSQIPFSISGSVQASPRGVASTAGSPLAESLAARAAAERHAMAASVRQKLLTFYCLLLQYLKQEAENRHDSDKEAGRGEAGGEEEPTLSFISTCERENLTVPIAVLEVDYVRDVSPISGGLAPCPSVAATAAAGGGAAAASASFMRENPLGHSSFHSTSSQPNVPADIIAPSLQGEVSLSRTGENGGGAGGSIQSSSPSVEPVGSHAHCSCVLQQLLNGEMNLGATPGNVVFDKEIVRNPLYGGWFCVESTDAFRRVMKQFEVSEWPSVLLLDPCGNVVTSAALDRIEEELLAYVDAVRVRRNSVSVPRPTHLIVEPTRGQGSEDPNLHQHQNQRPRSPSITDRSAAITAAEEQVPPLRGPLLKVLTTQAACSSQGSAGKQTGDSGGDGQRRRRCSGDDSASASDSLAHSGAETSLGGSVEAGMAVPETARPSSKWAKTRKDCTPTTTARSASSASSLFSKSPVIAHARNETQLPPQTPTPTAGSTRTPARSGSRLASLGRDDSHPLYDPQVPTAEPTPLKQVPRTARYKEDEEEEDGAAVASSVRVASHSDDLESEYFCGDIDTGDSKAEGGLVVVVRMEKDIVLKNGAEADVADIKTNNNSSNNSSCGQYSCKEGNTIAPTGQHSRARGSSLHDHKTNPSSSSFSASSSAARTSSSVLQEAPHPADVNTADVERNIINGKNRRCGGDREDGNDDSGRVAFSNDSTSFFDVIDNNAGGDGERGDHGDGDDVDGGNATHLVSTVMEPRGSESVHVRQVPPSFKSQFPWNEMVVPPALVEESAWSAMPHSKGRRHRLKNDMDESSANSSEEEEAEAEVGLSGKGGMTTEVARGDFLPRFDEVALMDATRHSSPLTPAPPLIRVHPLRRMARQATRVADALAISASAAPLCSPSAMGPGLLEHLLPDGGGHDKHPSPPYNSSNHKASKGGGDYVELQDEGKKRSAMYSNHVSPTLSGTANTTTTTTVDAEHRGRDASTIVMVEEEEEEGERKRNMAFLDDDVHVEKHDDDHHADDRSAEDGEASQWQRAASAKFEGATHLVLLFGAGWHPATEPTVRALRHMCQNVNSAYAAATALAEGPRAATLPSSSSGGDAVAAASPMCSNISDNAFEASQHGGHPSSAAAVEEENHLSRRGSDAVPAWGNAAFTGTFPSSFPTGNGFVGGSNLFPSQEDVGFGLGGGDGNDATTSASGEGDAEKKDEKSKYKVQVVYFSADDSLTTLQRVLKLMPDSWLCLSPLLERGKSASDGQDSQEGGNVGGQQQQQQQQRRSTSSNDNEGPHRLLENVMKVFEVTTFPRVVVLELPTFTATAAAASGGGGAPSSSQPEKDLSVRAAVDSGDGGPLGNTGTLLLSIPLSSQPRTAYEESRLEGYWKLVQRHAEVNLTEDPDGELFPWAEAHEHVFHVSKSTVRVLSGQGAGFRSFEESVERRTSSVQYSETHEASQQHGRISTSTSDPAGGFSITHVNQNRSMDNSMVASAAARNTTADTKEVKALEESSPYHLHFPPLLSFTVEPTSVFASLRPSCGHHQHCSHGGDGDGDDADGSCSGGSSPLNNNSSSSSSSSVRDGGSGILERNCTTTADASSSLSLPLLLERGGYFVVLCAMGEVDSALHKRCLRTLETVRTWMYELIEDRKERAWAEPYIIHQLNPHGANATTITVGGETLLLSPCNRAITFSSSPQTPTRVSSAGRHSGSGGDGKEEALYAPQQQSLSGAASPYPAHSPGWASLNNTGSLAGTGASSKSCWGLSGTGDVGAMPLQQQQQQQHWHVPLPSVYFFNAVFGVEEVVHEEHREEEDAEAERRKSREGKGGEGAGGTSHRVTAPGGLVSLSLTGSSSNSPVSDRIVGLGTNTTTTDAAAQTFVPLPSLHEPATASRPRAKTRFINTEVHRENHERDIGFLQEYIITPILERDERQLPARDGELFLACVRLPHRTTAVLRRKHRTEREPATASSGGGSVGTVSSPPGVTTGSGAATATAASQVSPLNSVIAGGGGSSSGPLSASGWPPALPHSTARSSAAHADREGEEEDVGPSLASVPAVLPAVTAVTTPPPSLGVAVSGQPSVTTSLSNTVRTEVSGKGWTQEADLHPLACVETVKHFLLEQLAHPVES